MTMTRRAADVFSALIHNSFALLGLGVVIVAIGLLARPDLRQQGEAQLRQWLHERHLHHITDLTEPEAIDRATAAHPHELPPEQADVAFWLSKKYRVAPEPLAALVAEAYDQGKLHNIDPRLILAVMAIESRFNPFAQSHVGAQGLMQVMTGIHADKYANFGGKLAAFDPVSNLRVGVMILKDNLRRTGTVEGALRHYVGAAHPRTNDGGYVTKVMAEYHRLRGLSEPEFALQDVAAAVLPSKKPDDKTRKTAQANKSTHQKTVSENKTEKKSQGSVKLSQAD